MVDCQIKDVIEAAGAVLASFGERNVYNVPGRACGFYRREGAPPTRTKIVLTLLRENFEPIGDPPTQRSASCPPTLSLGNLYGCPDGPTLM